MEDDPDDIADFFNRLDTQLYQHGMRAYKEGRPPLESMGFTYMDGYNETKFLHMDSVVFPF